MALGDPHQRTRRIAECRRLQKATQVFQQRGIGSRERRPSAAGAANLRARAIRRRQILQAAIDRAARDPARLRHGAHAAYPAERASAAANNRRSRSSSRTRIASKRSRIAASSIMPP